MYFNAHLVILKFWGPLEVNRTHLKKRAYLDPSLHRCYAFPLLLLLLNIWNSIQHILYIKLSSPDCTKSYTRQKDYCMKPTIEICPPLPEHKQEQFRFMSFTLTHVLSYVRWGLLECLLVSAIMEMPFW